MTDNKTQRRKRYSGKYPKRFEEKYKEMQPEKYKDLVEHVIQKGNTPAGMHRSIMVDEILNFLDIKEGMVGLDVTLGFGGHSKELLKKLNHTGHLFATDQDPIELPKTKQRLMDAGFTEKDFTLYNFNFKDIDLIEQDGFDFIIGDLGVSSMQIDDPSRGFTFKFDAPLDLRMNPNVGVPASEKLKLMSQVEIEGMLRENADEPYARQISQEILKTRHQGKQIETTKDLHESIKRALQFIHKNDFESTVKKSSQRTFQALRIDVNEEYEVLYELLEKIPNLLKKDGKVAILTFHSGEDRLVKKSFKQFYNEGLYKAIDGPLQPSLDEISSNSRARSAKLRTAIKA